MTDFSNLDELDAAFGVGSDEAVAIEFIPRMSIAEMVIPTAWNNDAVTAWIESKGGECSHSETSVYVGMRGYATISVPYGRVLAFNSMHGFSIYRPDQLDENFSKVFPETFYPTA